MTESQTAVSTFPNLPVEVTEGRGLVFGLEAVQTTVLNYNHPPEVMANASAPRLAVLALTPLSGTPSIWSCKKSTL